MCRRFGVFPLLHQLLAQVVPKLWVVLFRFRQAGGQFGCFFVVAVGHVVFDQGFQQLLRFRRILDLPFDLLDHVGKLARSLEDGECVLSRGQFIPIRRVTIPGISIAGTTQQLVGHLCGDFILSLRLILLHQVGEDLGSVSRLTSCSRKYRLGLFVHAKLMHLLR